MNYEVEIAENAEKFLKKIPKKDRTKIIEKIDSLMTDPMPVDNKKLHGRNQALYRIRSGDYRIVYTIKSDILLILVIEIGHRKDIYR